MRVAQAGSSTPQSFWTEAKFLLVSVQETPVAPSARDRDIARPSTNGTPAPPRSRRARRQALPERGAPGRRRRAAPRASSSRIEGPGGPGTHQTHRPGVGRQMAQRRRTPTHRKETRASGSSSNPRSRGLPALGTQPGGPLQIADLQCRRARFPPASSHHPRGLSSPTTSGAYSVPRKPGPNAPGLSSRLGAMLTKPGSSSSSLPSSLATSDPRVG